MSYTDDEVFDALQRIPKHELDKRLEIYSVWFEDRRLSYYAAVAANKRIEFKNKLRRLARLNEYILHDVNQWDVFINGEIETAMHGTGWTIESYTAVVDKPILEKRKAVRNIKLKRRAYFIVGFIISFIVGTSVGMWTGAPLVDSMFLGISLYNIVTLSAIWVLNKIWPWPYSYWWQYE